MTRAIFLLTVCFLLICRALPLHAQQATLQCAYTFTSGSSNSYLNYCVTVNGNIARIETPKGWPWIGPEGEGYGICNESPAQNYTDYGVSDTGNWHKATLLSKTSTSVEITRTTSDGHWTLTQTITQVSSTPSIIVTMALKNNQSAPHVAYLVRFADPDAAFAVNVWLGGFNHALARTNLYDAPGAGVHNHGLELENVGAPPFSFWSGFAQATESGPNACAFAGNESFDPNSGLYNSSIFPFAPVGSIEMAYVGAIGAGQTKTVTLIYRGI